MRAEGFHRRRVEGRAVGATGKRQAREDLAVSGAQNHHHGLRGLRKEQIAFLGSSLVRAIVAVTGRRTFRGKHILVGCAIISSLSIRRPIRSRGSITG